MPLNSIDISKLKKTKEKRKILPKLVESPKMRSSSIDFHANSFYLLSPSGLHIHLYRQAVIRGPEVGQLAFDARDSGVYSKQQTREVKFACFQEELDKVMTAFSLARHSVGRLRKEFMKKSSIVSTDATPTNLQFPCLSNLSPFPLLIFPFDSSDVKTVFTSNGGAL